MTIATLVQSQTLATLLQALEAQASEPAGELAPGKTVEATLLTLDGDGQATAQLGNIRLALLLAGPLARQADLQPGSTLVIRLDAAQEKGGALRATLVETRPAATNSPLPSPAASPAPIPGASDRPPQTLPRDVPPAQPQLSAGASAGQRGAATSANAANIASQRDMLSSNAMASNPSGSALAGQRVAAAGVAAEANAASSAAIASNSSISSPAASARAAAAPLLGQALARQDSLAPLLANLRSVTEGPTALTMPRPLLALVQGVLSQAIPVERRAITGEVLKQAVQRSGVFMEARQMESQTEGKSVSQPVPPEGDLKAGLVALREALAPLVERLIAQTAGKPDALAKPEDAAKPGQPAMPRTDDRQSQQRPLPPQREGMLAAQPIAEPSLVAGEKPLALTQTLLAQTDAALDRITLSQYASLPVDAARPEAAQGARLITEIPLAFQQGAAVLPLRIEQEPPRRGPAGIVAPLWRLRFALDVEPMGPLQGVVTLQGRSVGVTLWAEREDTSRMLRGAAPDLEAALTNAAFENGTIDVHTGQPRVVQPTAGQFLDRLS